MSVQIMAQVFSAEGLTSTQKLVLLALADHANDEGLSIYPGIDRLCHKTALGDRAVRKAIKELQAISIVSIVGRSKYKTNEYAINTAELAALTQPAPRADDPTGTSDQPNRHHVPMRPAPRADKSSVKPSVKPPIKDSGKPPDPRKDAPQIVAWRAATERYPSKDQWDYVIEHLPPVVDVPKLKQVYSAWRARDFRATNVEGMIEWYLQGIPANGNHRTNGRPSRYDSGIKHTIAPAGVVPPDYKPDR